MSRVLVKNAGDREQVERGRTHEERRARQQADDLRFVLGTPAGRRFVWRVLRTANPGVQFEPDARYQAFVLGNANVATWIEREIERACPELYDLMRQEARKHEESNDVA